MALQIQNLDLEEQEQLAQLRHFWNRWGNLILGVLIVVLGAFAAWNGWQLWQRKQGAQASAVLEALENAAEAGDAGRVQERFADLTARYAHTLQATHGALATAAVMDEKNQPQQAQNALEWAALHGDNAGLRAVARLRLASLHMDAKQWDKAAQDLTVPFPAAFAAPAADRQGDLAMLQGKRDEAVAAYRKAFAAASSPANADLRRLIAVKLNAVGVDPTADEKTAVSEAQPASATAPASTASATGDAAKASASQASGAKTADKAGKAS